MISFLTSVAGSFLSAHRIFYSMYLEYQDTFMSFFRNRNIQVSLQEMHLKIRSGAPCAFYRWKSLQLKWIRRARFRRTGERYQAFNIVQHERLSSGNHPDKVYGTNMAPTGGRQDPSGPHVGPMNFAIWAVNIWYGLVSQPYKFPQYFEVGPRQTNAYTFLLVHSG